MTLTPIISHFCIFWALFPYLVWVMVHTSKVVYTYWTCRVEWQAAPKWGVARMTRPFKFCAFSGCQLWHNCVGRGSLVWHCVTKEDGAIKIAGESVTSYWITLSIDITFCLQYTNCISDTLVTKYTSNTYWNVYSIALQAAYQCIFLQLSVLLLYHCSFPYRAVSWYRLVTRQVLDV